jgi:2-dehydro-3-deoxygalactonokinase
MPSVESSFVGIDWGTTHRRVYALDASGACVQSLADEQGALACKGRFSEALEGALQTLQMKTQSVLMSGMVGSALGWQEVPYVDQSVALADLPNYLVSVAEPMKESKQRVIVPGYCVRNAWGQPDVMRGEETQLLGAWALGRHTGWFVLPGTHSKWVELRDGRIVQLRTYMTGELFDLLSKNGTLAAAAGSTAQVWDDAAFEQGVQAADRSGLSHQLFTSRARVVCGDMPASSARSYLSGLLIGAELQDVLASGGKALRARKVCLIGTEALAQHYQAAAGAFHMAFEVLDAQAAYLAALAHFQTHWKPS